jgi:hypothetical protein
MAFRQKRENLFSFCFVTHFLVQRTLQHYVPEVISVLAVDDDDLTKINMEEFRKVESKTEKKD